MKINFRDMSSFMETMYLSFITSLSRDEQVTTIDEVKKNNCNVDLEIRIDGREVNPMVFFDRLKEAYEGAIQDSAREQIKEKLYDELDALGEYVVEERKLAKALFEKMGVKVEEDW